MAFTGVPVVKLVSDNMVRITGLSLAAGATGTVGLFGSAAQVDCPDAFNPTPYEGVSLLDSLTLDVVNAATQAAGANPSAMFYGLTAGTGNSGANNYPAPIAVDSRVEFPRNGPATAGSGIISDGVAVQLPVTGIYRVSWEVTFTEASQLVLKRNFVEIPETLSYSSSSNRRNTNTVLITATAGDQISLYNASGNAAALTVETSDANFTHAQAPTLLVELVEPGVGGGATDLSIVKTDAPFVFTVTNNGAGATPALEMYVRYHT